MSVIIVILFAFAWTWIFRMCIVMCVSVVSTRSVYTVRTSGEYISIQ